MKSSIEFTFKGDAYFQGVNHMRSPGLPGDRSMSHITTGDLIDKSQHYRRQDIASEGGDIPSLGYVPHKTNHSPSHNIKTSMEDLVPLRFKS